MRDAFGVERDSISKGLRDPKLKRRTIVPAIKGGKIDGTLPKKAAMETVITRRKDSLILRRPRYYADVQMKGYKGNVDVKTFRSKQATTKEGAKVAHKYFEAGPGKRPTKHMGMSARWVDAR